MPQHLLLTSFAIPRLVKRILSDMNLYELTDDDAHDIDIFEDVLNLPDVFARADPDQDPMCLGHKIDAWQQLVPCGVDRPVVELKL